MKFSEISDPKANHFSAIYRLRNLKNSKVYIGQTVNFYNRMMNYRNYQGDCLINKAIKKHGIENFEVDVLERDILREFLNEREQFYFDLFKPFVPQGYNLCRIAGSPEGIKLINKIKRKTVKKQKKFTDEGRRRLSLSRMGRKPTHSRAVIRIDSDNTKVEYSSLHAAARDIGCHVNNIWGACNGKSKTAKGYKWEYRK